MNIVGTTLTGNFLIDGAIGAAKWENSLLTYTFPTSVSEYDGYRRPEPYNNFGPLSEVQKSFAEKAMSEWSNVSNVKFQYVNTEALINFGVSAETRTGSAYLPSTTEEGGDVWLSRLPSLNNPIEGTYGYHLLIHEIGHSLGLKHPIELGRTPFQFDNMNYSVVSTQSYASPTALPAFTNAVDSYVTSPMIMDILAIQEMYGANYSFNSGDTTYRYLPNNGKIFETIWDGGGRDTLDFSAYSSNLSISLIPGTFSSFGNNQLANLGNGNSAIGNIAMSHLFHGNPTSLIENVVSGYGDDKVVGNFADNVFYSYGGTDKFVGGFGTDLVSVEAEKSITSFSREGNQSILIDTPTNDMVLKDIDFLTIDNRVFFMETAIEFNEKTYLAVNPDVKAAVENGFSSGKDHWVNYGIYENRMSGMAYDETFYLDTNPDVKASVISGGNKNGIDHYLNFGMNEGRKGYSETVMYEVHELNIDRTGILHMVEYT